MVTPDRNFKHGDLAGIVAGLNEYVLINCDLSEVSVEDTGHVFPGYGSASWYEACLFYYKQFNLTQNEVMTCGAGQSILAPKYGITLDPIGGRNEKRADNLEFYDTNYYFLPSFQKVVLHKNNFRLFRTRPVLDVG